MVKFIVQKLLSHWEESRRNPVKCQQKLFTHLLRNGARTSFGRQHEFGAIRSYEDFRSNMPLRDYDGFIPYIERIAAGEKDVLYPGRPRYFAKSSGTVANVKYLPVTASHAQTFAACGLNMLCSYTTYRKNYRLLYGQKLFVQGSPELEDRNGIFTGRLSGISYHLIPWILRLFQYPRYETNIIKNWEQKVRAIARESRGKKIRIIAGIPPWMMMYFEELTQQTGKNNIMQIFPELELCIHGGVNFEPYRKMFLEKVGRTIDTLDTYTASEGFFGFQELPEEKAITLCCDSGVFYEFVPAEDIRAENPRRIPLEGIETGRDYTLVITTMSGLWSYVIGDIVRFVDKYPFKFVVTGRVSEFTSLFGEHVIEQEVRTAIRKVSESFGLEIKYFTVAPLLSAEQGRSCHEWWIEFDRMPDQIRQIEEKIDNEMCRQNPYYKDLIEGKILSKAKIIPVIKGGFSRYLQTSGKMDGQNKLSLLANNRNLTDALAPYRLTDRTEIP